MTVLDDVKPGTMIRGVVPGHSVRIVSVDWIGNQAINLVPLHSDFDRLRWRRRGRNGAQMVDFQSIITSVQRY